MTDQKRDIVSPDFVREIVAEFDGKETAFPEWALTGALTEAKGKNKDMPQEERNGWWSENVAFRFSPCGRGQSPWGTYFGPVTTLGAKDGTAIYCPDSEDDGDVDLGDFARFQRTFVGP